MFFTTDSNYDLPIFFWKNEEMARDFFISLLHFKSPTAERRRVLSVGVGGVRTHAARPGGAGCVRQRCVTGLASFIN
jgi:hypothetical protein